MFRWLDFKITNRCNNRCVYCGVPHDSPDTKELLETRCIENALEDALDIGFTHFALLGGEPSMREDVERILKPFKGSNPPQTVMVVTNGLVFREGLYRELFSTDATEALVVFSFDSFKKPNYKFQDPATSLRRIRAIQAIARQCEDDGKRRAVTVHAVISRENLQDIEEHVERFRKMNIDVSLALVCPAVFISQGVPQNYNEFSYAELDTILAQLESLEAKDHLNFANRTLLEFLTLYPYGRLQVTSTCRAGRQVAVVNPDGSVFPCIAESYRGGVGYGNIASESFKTIYHRMGSFVCSSCESQSCWDHFLWDRLADRFESDRGE